MTLGRTPLLLLAVLAAASAGPSLAEDGADLLLQHGVFYPVQPSGRVEGSWLPGERLTREEALRGFTLDAAWSLFLENAVGSLEVGKRADLVVFARDIMTVPEAEIPRVDIDMTLVDGQIVHERGRTP